MSKEKLQRRSALISGGYDKVVATFEKNEIQNVLQGIVYDPTQEDIYTKLVFEIGKDGIKECHRINANQYNRAYRVRKKVKELIEFPCLFLTATFRDDVLKNTTQKTRRQYLVDFLNSFDNNGYVANIDFGVDDHYTQREHYHILVAADMVSQDLWQYGNLDWQRVRIKGSEKDKSIRKIPRYIAKLTNHAIKDNKQMVSIIYNKKKKPVCK